MVSESLTFFRDGAVRRLMELEDQFIATLHKVADRSGGVAKVLGARLFAVARVAATGMWEGTKEALREEEQKKENRSH